ncbi:MAG: F0F1 ATP synthase subunit A [Anaerolineaceae bacterium]|nr:F0F1 ATP synthase subunit A [Anaerolineaceae bacterium]
MMTKTIEKKKKNHGTFRWIVLGLFVLTGLASFFVPPVKPEINAGAESLTGTLFTLPVIGEFKISNALTGMLLVDLIVILIAWSAKRSLEKPNPDKRTFGGVLVIVLVMLYELTERTAGKWARKVFPWFLSITLIVLISNYSDIIPGVATIGILEPSISGTGVRTLIPNFLTTITRNTQGSQLYSLIPFLRSPSTDLNFPLSLALIVVLTVQITGFKYQGFGYLKKFFNFKAIITKPGLGLMDFIVGLLDLITEFSKVLSFSFRLFGSLFAGLVLFALSGTFIPVIGQTGVMAFELFMGLIQAFVFGLLTMVFMSQAMTGSHSQSEKVEEKKDLSVLPAGKNVEEFN